MSPRDGVRARVPPARLRRFFRHREPVPFSEAEVLTGCSRAWLAHALEIPADVPASQSVRWADVAFVVLRVWPPAELEAMLGGIVTFPELLRVSLVQWRIPAYVLVALEHLVAEARATDEGCMRLTVEAYVARHLDMLLEPNIVRRLSAEPRFRAAFQFPDEEER